MNFKYDRKILEERIKVLRMKPDEDKEVDADFEVQNEREDGL